MRAKRIIGAMVVGVTTATVVVVVVAATPAAAAVIPVTTDADSGPGSFRAAVEAASLDPTPSTIDFAPDLHLVVGAPVVYAGEADLVLDGERTVLDGGDVESILEVVDDDPLVTLEGVEVVNAADSAIVSEGDVSLVGSYLHDNATGEGGSVVRTHGSITVESSRFEDNIAEGGGGALSARGSVTVTDATFARNQADTGGAITAGELLRAEGSTFTDNEALRGDGGAARAGEVQLVDSTFERNVADGLGGAVHFSRWEAGPSTISGSTFTENVAEDDGGAISGAVDTIEGSTFDGNGADNGGAVTHVDHLVGSSFVDNHADGNTGAVTVAHDVSDSTFRGNAAGGDGGGLVLTNSPDPIPVERVSVIDNTAGGDGGGVHFAFYHQREPITIRNSTISGNHATGDGGGIHTPDATTTVLDHVSVVDNVAATGDALVVSRLGAIGSIISSPGAAGDDCVVGQVIDAGFDLVADASCRLRSATDRVVAAGHGLGPVVDQNGVLVRVPQPGGPSLDAIPRYACHRHTPEDQLGHARPQGAGCDVGAVERPAATAPAAAPEAAPEAANEPIVVPSPLDTVGGPLTSLRDAVAQASSQAGDDVVRLAGATYPLALGCDETTDTPDVGDLDHTDAAGRLTIEGNGATIEQTCTSGHRVLESLGPLTLQGVTITGGNVPGGQGGGVRVANSSQHDHEARFEGVTVTGNEATDGGGLYVTGEAVILDTEISDNVARGANARGGGARTLFQTVVERSRIVDNQVIGTSGTSVMAGGIAAGGQSSDLVDTLVQGNVVEIAESAPAGVTARGGGVTGFPDIQRSAVIGNALRRAGSGVLGTALLPPVGGGILGAPTIDRSTVHGNSVEGPHGRGGGIGLTGFGSMDLDHVTVTANSAATGANLAGDTTGWLENSAVGEPAGGGENCAWRDDDRLLNDSGHTVVDDESCRLDWILDVEDVPLQLSPLGDWGGPTPSRHPVLDSPLLDRVRCVASSGEVDQRGEAVPIGPACEAGAVEWTREAPGPPIWPPDLHRPLQRTETTVTVAWSDPIADGGAARVGWNVYRDGELAGTAPPTAHELVITGLEPGTPSTWTVTLVTARGESPPSAEVGTETIRAPVPRQPEDLAASRRPGRVEVTWDYVVNAAEYRVVRNGEVRGTVPQSDSWGHHVEFEDTGVQPGARYRYEVIAVNSWGESPPGVLDVRAYPATGFADVPDRSVLAPALEWATFHHVVGGGSRFRPRQALPRVAAARMLWVMAGRPVVSGRHPWRDAPHTRPLDWLYVSGIDPGRTSTTFGPNVALTRRQLVNWQWKLAGRPGVGVRHADYEDVPRPGHAVDWAGVHGIVAPLDDDLRPTAAATRGQVVRALFRLATVEAAWDAQPVPTTVFRAAVT